MAPPTQSLSGNPSETEEGESQDFDHLAKWEVLKCRLNALKKKQVGLSRRGEKQGELQEKLNRLDIEKEIHIREVRRINDESNSKYCERPLLQGRYQIVELLGKGGFSEVWYAIDLWSLCEVAIKVHQLASTWSDERKSSYIKHAIRENDIQKVGVCGGGKA